ncbi:MAG: HD domain-containing protein [Clostridia bacterium]|nr:HD domain-containing protein [Clostridia bacterium]
MNESFRPYIDRYVKAMVKGYLPTATGTKIIHDPIWGSVVFHPWEVRLIDSPLFQRLRNVNQVGLADSTYPAARHTRFEHSLGTAAIASRMMEQLSSEARQRPDVASVIGEDEIRLVRLAALLHDVGHCPYSHLSEAVYGTMPEFAPMREYVIAATGQEISPSPHEVFSYLIIVSDAFINFFFRNIHYPGVRTRAQAKELLQRAANMVVGAVNCGKDGTKYSYLTTVLNGNFDADKLDYTQRDSYTAGIALTYGVERFLLKLVLCKTEEQGVIDYRLGITADALSTVEELLFNRSMLYHYMYRHQKVLAAEAQMRDAIYALVRVGKIKHPCDFLFLNNQELSALYHSKKRPFATDGAETKTLESLMQAFSRRTLPKRALELSPDSFSEQNLPDQILSRTLKNLESAKSDVEKKQILQDLLDQWQQNTLFPETVASYIQFLKNCSVEQNIAERKIIAEKIAEAYETVGKPVDFDAFDLVLSFQPPLETDLSLTVVDKQHRPLPGDKAIQRIEDWTQTFNRGKWRGYLFVAPHVDRTLAGTAFQKYLNEWGKK